MVKVDLKTRIVSNAASYGARKGGSNLLLREKSYLRAVRTVKSREEGRVNDIRTKVESKRPWERARILGTTSRPERNRSWLDEFESKRGLKVVEQWNISWEMRELEQSSWRDFRSEWMKCDVFDGNATEGCRLAVAWEGRKPGKSETKRQRRGQQDLLESIVTVGPSNPTVKLEMKMV